MKKPIYLDYMATTPVDPRVVAKMQHFLSLDGEFGNPASISHVYGKQALAAVEIARQQVADLIAANPNEIIWTSGATEANNLAIKGVAQFYKNKGQHIITCKTEHKAVLDPCHYLQSQGFEVTYLAPKTNGLIDINEIKSAIKPETILISIMHVNNEIGVIQDIGSIGKLAREKQILFHVDAAQSAGKVEINVNEMNVDLMSFSAHKVYGPKGVGALYVRQKPRVRLVPLIHGGGHEQGLRSGTLATHQIVAMGEAFKIAKCEMAEEIKRIKQLRDQLWNEMQSLGYIYLNGDLKNRVAHNLNISVAFVEGEALLMALKDIAISSGSACTSASIEPSHVLKAIGCSDEFAHASLRFSLGRFTTQEDIQQAIEIIKSGITRLRVLSPLTPAT